MLKLVFWCFKRISKHFAEKQEKIEKNQKKIIKVFFKSISDYVEASHS